MTGPDFPLVDSHCHLPLMDAHGGAWAAVARAREAGVGQMLCVSVDFEGLPEILNFADADAAIFATVGVHPNSHPGVEFSSDLLTRLSDHPKVIGIGETGLDFFRSEGDLSWQYARFRAHIQAAKACRKPLIIHSRDARAETIAVLRAEKADEVGGIMHCFVEDYDTASAAIDLGFLISFSGIVTFKTASELQSVARRLPLDRILVETDSPYLAPVPKRGKPNEPGYVRHVANFLAELRGESFDEIAAVTSCNFRRLFSLPLADSSP